MLRNGMGVHGGLRGGVAYRAKQNCNLAGYTEFSNSNWQDFYYYYWFQVVIFEQQLHDFCLNSPKLPCVSSSGLNRSKPSAKVSKLLSTLTRYFSEFKINEKINHRSNQRERNIPVNKLNQFDF